MAAMTAMTRTRLVKVAIHEREAQLQRVDREQLVAAGIVDRGTPADEERHEHQGPQRQVDGADGDRDSERDGADERQHRGRLHRHLLLRLYWHVCVRLLVTRRVLDGWVMPRRRERARNGRAWRGDLGANRWIGGAGGVSVTRQKEQETGKGWTNERREREREVKEG